MSIEATQSLAGLPGRGVSQLSKPLENPAASSPSNSAAGPERPAQTSAQASQASGSASPAHIGEAKAGPKASADSVIQAMLAAAQDGERDGKLPLEFSVDPTILTKEVAREMSAKLQRTLEETMMLEKMRAIDAANGIADDKAATTTIQGATETSNAYDLIRSSQR